MWPGAGVIGACWKNFKSSALLTGAGYCFVIACSLSIFYLYCYWDEPRPVERVLVTTEGTLYAYADSSQYSTSFLVKENSGKLIKLTAVPDYARLIKGFGSNLGKAIVVRHYEGRVIACRIEGVEFCIPRCFTSWECQIKVVESGARAMRQTIYTVLFMGVGLVLLFMYRKL